MLIVYIYGMPLISFLRVLPTRQLFLYLFASACLVKGVNGQSGQDPLIDAAGINLAIEIRDQISSAFVSNEEELVKKFPDIPFTRGAVFNGPIPEKYVTKTALVRFRIHNSSSSLKKLYFFPGFYYQKIRVYRVSGKTLELLPEILPDNKEKIGYREISIATGDSMEIIASLGMLKTYVNKIRPRLVNPEYLSSFIAGLHDISWASDLFTYVFCGLLLMMVLYSLSVYFQGANKEFLYYSGYAFFIGLMLFTKALYNYHTEPMNFFLEEYLDFVLQATGIIFYMIFMQKFLDTRNHYQFLNRLYNSGIFLLLFATLAFSVLHYATDLYHIEFLVEQGTKFLLLLMIVVFLVYSSRYWHIKLFRYLFWGNFFYLLFSLISYALIIAPGLFPYHPIATNSLIHYETGLFFELVFFLGGLNYKNRRYIIAQTKEKEALKAQAMVQEYEKEIAVYKAQQEERQRISADMHDELGSGMTAIRLMSEIARNKMKEHTPVEIEKISRSADDVLNKMNAIIWSMNSSNDTLDNLISYIRAWSLEYFESTPVRCRVQTPEEIPQQELTGDKRRNIFLCVKESLNNVLKHAGASEVSIDIKSDEQELLITIHDNGKGIDKEKLRQFGNGLKNIGRRMESIGGTFLIQNEGGTVTTLRLPL